MCEEKKAIEAAELIKNYCKSFGDMCLGCKLRNSFGSCSIHVGPPSQWKIPKPRRFTDADRKLAEALKAFGAYELKRSTACGDVYCYSNNNGEKELAFGLPEKAFKSIEVGERVPIDDIIKEGKNND